MHFPKNLLWCILASSIFLAGCGSNISRTTTNSDATATITSEDIAPIKVHGSKKIRLEGKYVQLNDNGLQQISIPSKVSTGNADASILTFLDTLTNPEATALTQNPKLLAIKQATVTTQGSSLTLIGGSGLQAYISPLHLTTQVSGDNLIITANPGRAGTPGYLLISNKNLENFMIQSVDDRYNPGLFMISKDIYTLIKIDRQDDLNNPYISYQTGEKKIQISNRAGDLTIADQSTINIEIPDSPSLKKVYKIRTKVLDNKPVTNEFLTMIEKDFSKGVTQDLAKRLASTLSGEIVSYQLLTPNGSGIYTFMHDDSIMSDGDAIVMVNAAHSNVLTWTTPALSITLNDVPGGSPPYMKVLQSNYQLDEQSIQQALQSVLTTGEYVYYGGNQFTYKIQPKKKYQGDLRIKNIYGQEMIVPLSLYIDAIDPRVIHQQVLANNTISLLPNNGSFQDVLIQHENISSLPVTFTPCTITSNVDREQKNGQGLENYLFKCSDDQEYISTIQTKDFKYRKAYRTAVALPKGFPEKQAFKVSVPNQGNIQPYYFYKSDIGIWTKIAGDQLHIWGFQFADNSPMSQGTIDIQTIGALQTTIIKKEIKNTETIISLPKDSNGVLQPNLLLVTLTAPALSGAVEGAKSFVIVDPNRSSEHYRESSRTSYTINSYMNPQDVLTSNENIDMRGEEYPIKIYGYSDRGLYKAGDSIYFAGFMRDLRQFKDLGYTKGKTIAVTLNDPQGNVLYSHSGLVLDDFGGFKGSAPLPKTLPLGDAILSYKLNGDDRVYYSHNIKIEEYQKPNFFLDTSHSQQEDDLNLIMSPKYFFGQPLKNYDVNVSWSLAGKDICAYCSWWNQEAYYYNYVFNDSISTGGQFSLYNQTTETLQKSLFSKEILQQKGYQYALKANIIIKDNNSDETQFFTRYIDFAPEVKIGLSGQPSEWIYTENGKDTRKDFKISGIIKEGKSLVDTLGYEVLYRGYEQDMQQGIDGNIYAINGNNYRSITKGTVSKSENFSIPTKYITKPGSYIYRIYAKDSIGSIIGEVQKQIEYYEFSDDPDGLLGALPNNYTLTVNIPKKIYEEGEKIPVDIAPYQKGARVIMTVERGNQIIETIEKTLDGSPLTLTVKPGFTPNIVVNVMQIIGSDKATGPRKEPRFLVGYGQAEISTAMHEMQILVKTDKDIYTPNEKVQLTITTKDSSGKPIDARLSLGVIDKALMAMYDAKKEPIPYFFNKLGTSIANYTNMKLLYQSLKAFANNGSKGGAGMGGKAMFSMIRDDLEDVAFWRGAIYTTGGVADVSFTVPENLTTWVVDVIGISKDTRLGTTQKEFKVSKNLVIEANPPTFVTLGDVLQIPVKIIVAPEIYTSNTKVTGKAYIQNNSGDILDLGTFVTDANSKVLLTTKIPDTRINTPTIKLGIEGIYKGEKDSILQTIPLRTEGLIMKDSVGVIHTAGEHIFTIPPFRSAVAKVALSQFPTHLIDPVLTDLLLYAYGCSEQILSTLLPLKVAVDLRKTGAFTSTLLHDDTVDTHNGTIAITNMFADGINTLLSRQQQNGSFGLWQKDDTLIPTIQEYTLTAYIYASLQLLKDVAPSQATLNQSLKQAGSYLRTYRTLSQEGFLYYLTQKSLVGEKLTPQETAELETIKPQASKYGSVLRYIIAVGQQNTQDADTRRLLAVIPTNDDTRRPESTFLNQETMIALKTIALSQDAGATHIQRSEALQALLGYRQKSGIRGSTQNSVQALRAITYISQQRPSKDLANCSITIGDQTYTKQVNKTESISFQQDIYALSPTNVKRSCDTPLIVDTSMIYIPKNLENLLGASTHVTQMNYSISNPQAKIGETLDVNASRTITMPGEQVAVEIFIPSTLKFLASISPLLKGDQGGFAEQNFPFILSDPNCTPSHRETKFDRLFLYYDNLPAVTCDITIPALQAYMGTPVIQPMRVYEMYRGKVNGRKIIQ